MSIFWGHFKGTFGGQFRPPSTTSESVFPIKMSNFRALLGHFFKANFRANFGGNFWDNFSGILGGNFIDEFLVIFNRLNNIITDHNNLGSSEEPTVVDTYSKVTYVE